LEAIAGIVAFLQPIVRNAGVYVMDMMKADISGEPLEDTWQAEI
jgi:hypothetical protein